jgi:hypothetical protein
VTFTNDGIHDSVISSAYNLKFDLEKLSARLIFRLQENDRDELYQREFFQTSVDISKFVKGIGMNSFIAKTILGSFKKLGSLDFHFPIRKV